MKKGFYKLASVICFSLVFIFLLSAIASAESITFTTYYPSPFGVYRELRSQRMAIGETYYNPANHCWPDGPCPSPDISDNTDLIVEGRVGIGTTSPGRLLDVVNSSSTQDSRIRAMSTVGSGKSAFFEAWTDHANWGGYGLSNSDGTPQWWIGSLADPAGNLKFYVGPSTPERMRITSTGNVGIGTTEPDANLEISSLSSSLRITDTNGRLDNGNAWAHLQFEGFGQVSQIGHWSPNVGLQIDPGSSGQVIIPTGNVGIGTTSPKSKLQVNGDIQLNNANHVSCDSDHRGAIKYESDHFFGCRTTGWVQLD